MALHERLGALAPRRPSYPPRAALRARELPAVRPDDLGDDDAGTRSSSAPPRHGDAPPDRP